MRRQSHAAVLDDEVLRARERGAQLVRGDAQLLGDRIELDPAFVWTRLVMRVHALTDGGPKPLQVVRGEQPVLDAHRVPGRSERVDELRGGFLGRTRETRDLVDRQPGARGQHSGAQGELETGDGVLRTADGVDVEHLSPRNRSLAPAVAQHEAIAGRERNGLETGEVAVADRVVMIPVNSRFASLNLAQSVLILGYEWMKASERASLGRVTTYEKPLAAGLYLNDDAPATREALVGLFEHLEGELDRLGFFNPIEKRPTVVHNVRTMLIRMGATEQEVRTLRGIVATLAKGKGAARKSST